MMYHTVVYLTFHRIVQTAKPSNLTHDIHYISLISPFSPSALCHSTVPPPVFVFDVFIFSSFHLYIASQLPPFIRPSFLPNLPTR